MPYSSSDFFFFFAFHALLCEAKQEKKKKNALDVAVANTDRFHRVSSLTDP